MLPRLDLMQLEATVLSPLDLMQHAGRRDVSGRRTQSRRRSRSGRLVACDRPHGAGSELAGDSELATCCWRRTARRQQLAAGAGDGSVGMAYPLGGVYRLCTDGRLGPDSFALNPLQALTRFHCDSNTCGFELH